MGYKIHGNGLQANGTNSAVDAFSNLHQDRSEANFRASFSCPAKINSHAPVYSLEDTYITSTTKTNSHITAYSIEEAYIAGYIDSLYEQAQFQLEAYLSRYTLKEAKSRLTFLLEERSDIVTERRYEVLCMTYFLMVLQEKNRECQ